MNFFTSIENRINVRALLIAFAAGLFAFPSPAFCQQQNPPSPEEQEEKLTEYIQGEVDKLETMLKLEDWQVFYADSILTHDYHAMQEELNALSSSKITNYDIYTRAQDKWAEAMYVSLQKVFSEEQWTRYLKTGAGREKKARDKRKAKIDSSAANVSEND